VGIGYGTCQWVLMEELGMHRVTAKFVPRILTADQKQQHVNICTELCQPASNDEPSCPGSKAKQQSSQWKSPTSPRPKKARHVKSNVMSMITTFFDIKGIVHKEFVPTGQTLNSRFYCDVLW